MNNLRTELDQLEDQRLDYVMARSKVNSDAQAIRLSGVPKATFYSWDKAERDHLNELAQKIKRNVTLRMIAKLEVGKHAQFFNGSCRQVLRFVDDQQATFTFAGHADEERHKRHEDVGFRHILRANPEGCANQAQGVVRIQLCADQMSSNDLVRVETVEQSADNRRFAGANLAGNDDEPFVLVHAVFKVGSSTTMLLAREIKRRVGVQLKRLAGQSIE